MVVQEAEQVDGRVLQRQPGGRGPHAGHDRHDEVLHEVVGVAAQREPVERGDPAPTALVLGAGELQQPPRLPVEALHLGRHAQEAGGRPPGAAGRTGRPARARRRTPGAALARDGHGHLGRPGAHAELGEQPQQVRVGPLVVHDEAGVDGQDPVVRRRHVVRVRVPASRPSVSNSVTSWVVCSRWAAVSPETPDPTTAAVGRRSEAAFTDRSEPARGGRRALGTGRAWAGSSQDAGPLLGSGQVPASEEGGSTAAPPAPPAWAGAGHWRHRAASVRVRSRPGRRPG
ncbi:MAG: hypothetical protein JWR70_400 [Modestobacter sp.]|nr:hypothetical protein [Modestobacter sp.]